MIGHHEVKVFVWSAVSHPLTLPTGWEPFAVIPEGNSDLRIVARKWVRDDG